MTNYQLLKNKLLTKKSILFLIISLLILFIIFFINKNEILYGISNYINNNYLKYYIDSYLNGNASNLIINNNVIMYVENDVMKVLSAPYIYLFTQCSNIFKIYTIVFPLFLFYVIIDNLYDEIHNGFLRLKILKLGQGKYISSLIITTLIFGGFLASIPKIVYYLILNIFYNPGFSHSHFLVNGIFNEIFLDMYKNYDSILLSLIDIFNSFLYGMIISLIAILSIFLMKKKVNTYLFLIFIFFIQISICSVFINITKIPMMFSFYSIYDLIGVRTVFPSYISIIFSPIIIFLVLLILCILIVKRKIYNYI